MPGIAISELLRYNCTDGLNESLIPISVNGNTYSIKSSVFLNDLNNCINSTLNCVNQQGCTITTCLTDTSTLCNSIQCNESDITNIKQQITDISSQITDINGRVNLSSTLDDSCCLSQRITNNENIINNNASQITTLNGCIDTINEDLLIRASTTQVNNLENCLNSANSSIENLNTCTTQLQGQINTLDVSGQAEEFNCLSNKVTQNENSITNLCNTTTGLQGSISNINTRLVAKASANTVTILQSDLNTAEGNISSLQTCSTKFDNCISSIEGNLDAKANASAVGSISSALNTAQGNITSLQSCTTTLQNSINNLDVGSQASAINQLQTDVNTANSCITQSQSDITNLNTCVNSLNNTINATSSNVSTLQSTVNGFSSSISTACTLATNASNDVTSLESKYGVRVNANGAVAGFGILACANNSGECRTAFTIQANCFALEDQTGNDCIQPFVVENNKVRMCGACIKDLSVDTLQIGEQAISSCEFVSGTNKTYTIAAATNVQNQLPFGNWENRVCATIVSAGCPTIINFGYSGNLKGTTTTSPFTCAASGKQKRYCATPFNYCINVRVVRNGNYVLTGSSNNQFVDANPPAGPLTYALQTRFYRDYNKNHIYGGYSRYGTGWNISWRHCGGDTTISLLHSINTNRDCIRSKGFCNTGTQSLSLTNPFIEIRQNKR